MIHAEDEEVAFSTDRGNLSHSMLHAQVRDTTEVDHTKVNSTQRNNKQASQAWTRYRHVTHHVHTVDKTGKAEW